MQQLNNSHSYSNFHVTRIFAANSNRDMILLFCTDHEAQDAFEEIKFYCPDINLFYFPAWDVLPYDRISPSTNIMAERAKILVDIQNQKHNLLIASVYGILQKVPAAHELLDGFLEIKTGASYSREDLTNFLVKNGYIRSASANQAGEFAVRGDLVDVVTTEKAYRVNFAWDRIESIKLFSPETQITIAKTEVIRLYPPSELMLSDQNIENFKRNFLKNFGVNHIADPIYANTISGLKFQGIEHLLPLFYDGLVPVTNLLSDPIIIADDLFEKACKERIETIEDLFAARTDKNLQMASKYFAIKPEELWTLSPPLEMKKSLTTVLDNYSNIPNFIELSAKEKKVSTEIVYDYLKSQKLPVIVAANSETSRDRIEKLFDLHDDIKFARIDSLKDLKKKINIAIFPIRSGFIGSDFILISEQDILGEKIHYRTDSRKKLKNILTELDQLIPGELISHKDHGIGKFLGVEIIKISGKSHDCIKLLYQGDDKLFVPVENIELVKKYGHEYAELDKLGSLGWQKRSSRVKERVNLIAKSLMEIAAKRALVQIDLLDLNQEYYAEFCRKFPYVETEDQQNAIDDIKRDLESGKPMDRLICGDVGFGKTEVAMRAAFMVAASGTKTKPNQVAIIAPTTILARQHYVNFKERFRGFDIRIKNISRLVTRKEINENKIALKSGEIDIIIGTHALLSDDIKFTNLKLLIIDEEQHFGVKQKEKLKAIKDNVHVLSMSATPIPRTLQMSMLDIKQLSLIATPPIDRLATKTSVIPYDHVIIRDALMREHFRGGQSFYVAPRISDITEIADKLKVIVPELKFRIAHGKMCPHDIDEIMNDYYECKFDILLSTTIIESGIDIKTANTMIIHRAEMLGLSQLYQLRGRVGRSKLRGYVYLTLTRDKAVTKEALKRLELIASIESLGGSFAIASHDMDSRGFGNLLGEEQSGNVREVGVELYNDMLQEAILEAREDRVEEKSKEFSPVINIGVSVYIPDTYISDSILRMAIYRRIGDIRTEEDYMNFIYEMEDRFGKIPEEMNNLLQIIKIKNLCRSFNIEKFDLGEKGALLKFRECENLHEKIMSFIAKYPRISRIRPDNKLSITIESKETPINISFKLLEMLRF